jgi:uncharacterized protein involved in type VI secretion and phage assembly
VLNNVDPMHMGRLLVMVPDVSNIIPSTWAMPSVPMAGVQAGVHVVPPLGAGVWVEFEQGDPDYPIWSGGWWGSPAEVPALALMGLPASPNIVLQTTGQNTLMISDLPGPTGGIMLKSTTGAMLLINDLGITISNGKGATIAMIGPTITINQGALIIT